MVCEVPGFIGYNAGTVIEDTWCMKYLVPYG